jgi:RNA-directed DNA polymerase
VDNEAFSFLPGIPVLCLAWTVGVPGRLPRPGRRCRTGSRCAETSFTFLGYTFRARSAPARDGTSVFTGFVPAVSKDALKRMSGEVRSWRIHLRTATELQDLADWINPVVRGWMTCYGRCYRTALDRLLRRISTYMMRWAQRKYKRLRPFRKALRWWKALTERQPSMFAQWAWMTELSAGHV